MTTRTLTSVPGFFKRYAYAIDGVELGWIQEAAYAGTKWWADGAKRTFSSKGDALAFLTKRAGIDPKSVTGAVITNGVA